jgi:hypothetical protein
MRNDEEYWNAAYAIIEHLLSEQTAGELILDEVSENESD